jgi:signal transduction histidine kinase
VRARAGVVAIALAVLILLPDPSAPAVRAPAAPLDPSLRVPFAAVLLRAPHAPLTPGERVLGVHRDGDAGLVAPRGLASLLRALRDEPEGAPLALDVQGPHGARRVAVPVVVVQPIDALAAQWPAWLAASALLLFALACVLGGRHPIATPLFAVALCLGTGIGAAAGLALPGDAGLLGIANARSRAGLLAWCALPAALLHLSARFPIVVPSFRRRALAAVPYGLWAIPALVAQLRFGEAATVDAVERIALAASFLAGAILVAACAFPGRRLTAVERTRAGAALAGFAAAGAGPLLFFVRPHGPAPATASGLALASIALPLSLGWAVTRHRLLDPPSWLRRSMVSAATALLALLFAATATSAAWQTVGPQAASGSARAAVLALATALAYQGVRSIATRLLFPRAFAGGGERLLARASRELAGAAAPAAVLERLAALLRDELRPGGVAVFLRDAPPPDRLAERGTWLHAAAQGSGRRFLHATRAEDPDAASPEIVVALDPRAGPAALLVLAPRRDGLPFAPEELRAIDAVGRLATLALGDATASAHLEERVASRTAELRRALDDRSAVVEAAARIQAATRASDVRDAVHAFLARATGAQPEPSAACRAAAGGVAVALALEPSRLQRFAVHGLGAARAADLEPQVETVATLAGLALERIHLLAELKEEIGRQAAELAERASRVQRAELAREVAHELRKPAEEIRDLVHAVAAVTPDPRAGALDRIEAVAQELLRRLDCLLARDGRRLDARPIDLVRVTDAALARVARLRGDRFVVVQHVRPRLPLVADPMRIASLVENLLDNAWKATPEGGRVELRTELVARRGGPCVVLEVEDDGVGVPADLESDIFEPGVSRFREGFGLGLSFCRDAARAHGGRVGFDSAPGRTVFRVELPQLGPESAS